MQQAENYTDWILSTRPNHVSLFKSLRALIVSVEPDFEEGVRDGNLAYVKDGAPRVYLAEQSDDVYIGFYNASAMPDPHGIVNDAAETRGEIEVKSQIEPPPDVLREYIKASAELPPDASTE